ncbi:permease prefix domain 1-containing protein [Microbacterium sp. CFBP9034]|uniref:permease prefix domain 1-containing protein n=1 Tax=Microbacterium sp. CFBP9034 TaxID=3096540 RepID=UPI002A6A2B8E|nr:permease prefix domain 1-containing protein [Microbacterium sp. CFBP9034]MDY0908761.1 permease prefix domain 1-containing protein [Microbacterium sp. CFBP9034]
MNTDIHRLLDEAFAGVEMTPEAQDLKEEVRANLVARVEELETSGRPSSDAARQAIAELGDVSELLGEQTDAAPARDSYAAMQLRHRVRPKAGFVVRAVVWSLVFVVGMTVAVLGATGALPLPLGAIIGLVGFASNGLALLVGDSLSQETTTNHPMPANRAGGYFLATLLGTFGLGFGVIVVLGAMPLWGIVFAALGVIAAIILFAFLFASQTNRHKAWVRQAQHEASHVGNRFEDEPETAARFGIYTAVIWLVTFGVIVALVFTVGWWWAPLAFVGGFAAMMLLLARMLFAPAKS